jgi:thiamine-phosphate diphosphorylase
LAINRIIGCSVTTPVQATKAQNEGADYIAVGSIFPTTTKKEAIVVGVDTVRELKRTISTPLVAIGGINASNIGEVVAAGADAMAVVSAVMGERDLRDAVQKLVTRIDLASEKCQTQ